LRPPDLYSIPPHIAFVDPYTESRRGDDAVKFVSRPRVDDAAPLLVDSVAIELSDARKSHSF
jgi:hypothetical protein